MTQSKDRWRDQVAGPSPAAPGRGGEAGARTPERVQADLPGLGGSPCGAERELSGRVLSRMLI